MPRIHRMKDYDFEINERSDEKMFSKSGEETEENERSSGNSWLSNDAIISSFSESKLKEALTRYKAIVRLLETELLARSFISHTHPNEYFGQDGESYRRAEKEGKRSSSRKRSSRSNGEGNSEIYQVRQITSAMRSMLRKMPSLDSEAKRKLFEEWSKIQNEAVNHGLQKGE
jgi:hypothetical protein